MTDYLERNRAGWTKANEEYTDARASGAWAADEITWGMFGPSDDELGPPDEELTIGPKPYLRFEPVPSPTVLRQHLDTEGESLEHLVIAADADEIGRASCRERVWIPE